MGVLTPNERRHKHVFNNLRRTPRVGTLEEQSAGASALAAYALEEFRSAVEALESAAEQQDAVVLQTQIQIDALYETQAVAEDEAYLARSKASRVREYIL